MDYLFVGLVVAAVLGLCWFVDRGFTKIFRNRPQHFSGMSVRLHKRYATIGIVLTLLGIAAMIYNTVLLTGGIILTIVGVGLVTYYMTFGIFYDDDGFLLTTFGKKTQFYRYSDIVCQQLYLVTGRNITVELHLKNGRSVMLHQYMPEFEKFLDHAFLRWCHQTRRDPQSCPFHDPDNSLWFPSKED